VSLAVAPNDEIVLGAGCGPSAGFGGLPLSGPGFCLARLKPGGEHLWSKIFKKAPGFFESPAAAVAVDASGAIWLAGTFEGTLSLGGAELAASAATDFFVARFDASGAHLWSKSFGGAGADRVDTIAPRSDGAVLAGTFDKAVNLGGATLTLAGARDLFVLALDPGGGHLWSRGLGTAGFDAVGSVVASPGDTVTVTGTFDQSPMDGSADIFVVKLAADGTPLWSKTFPGAVPGNHGLGALLPGGDLVVAGTAKGTVDFGGGPLKTQAHELYAARFSP
jgi:hypothetical protein